MRYTVRRQDIASGRLQLPANGDVGPKEAGQSGSGDYQKTVRPTAVKEILIIFSY